MVALGPGQENALRLIRFRHPDSILLAVPTNLKTHEDAFRTQLPGLECVSVEVSPYDFNSTRRNLRNALRHSDTRTVEICVSSGPLAVRTAAMQLARDKGYRASHITFQKCLRIYDAFQPQATPEVAHNTLECYLATRDVEMRGCFPVNDALYKIADYLLEHLDIWTHVISCLRRALDPSGSPTDGKILSVSRSRLQPTHLNMLQELQEHQIIAGLNCKSGMVSVHITEDNWKYLDGRWLEVLVFHRLAGLFDDSSCGQELKTPEKTREIDFIGLQDGYFTLISCKTSSHSYEKKHLQELQSLSQQLSEPNSLRIYVTDRVQSSSQSNREYEDFVAFAQAQAIEVIFGNHLNYLRESVDQLLKQRRA